MTEREYGRCVLCAKRTMRRFPRYNATAARPGEHYPYPGPDGTDSCPLCAACAIRWMDAHPRRPSAPPAPTAVAADRTEATV